MNSAKKYTLIFLGLNFSILAILGASISCICYIIDPFCIYHKPWFPGHRYYNNQLMNFGIVNTLLKDSKYDTFIGVSSHFQDSPLIAEDHALNGYISSGSYLDFDFLLPQILKIRTLKNVIYSFELFWADPELRRAYLNRENLFLRSFQFLKDEILRRNGTPNLLRWSNRWQQPWCQMAQENFNKTAKSYKLNQNLSIQKITEQQKEIFSQIIDRHILPHIKKWPHKHFHFVIPPYSFIRFLTTERTMQYIYLQRLLVEKTSHFKNVKIYSFYDCDFVQNLANYYDPHHYTPYIIRYILYSVKNDLHRLTTQNLENYESRLIKKLENFKVRDQYGPMDKFEDIVEQEKRKKDRI